MHRPPGRITLLAILAASLISPANTAAGPPLLSVSVASDPQGAPMRSGFVGLSIETRALHTYTGRDPRAVNPVLVSLIRGLAPSQRPVLRIGGDSTDYTWWPVRGAIPPPGIGYGLTKGWLRATHALARDLDARLIVGVNLAGDRPALAAAEGRALVQGLGRRYIEALEIGNEPDLYGQFPWYRDRAGRVGRARPQNYDLSRFIADFSRWRAALPRVPLVGPSVAQLSWMRQLARFLRAEPAVRTATMHRYPLRGCNSNPAVASYPSIPHLLADSSAAGVAAQVAPFAAAAHARSVPLRVDEMQSVACSGRFGVSDSFASALWVLDTLFNLRAAGADGVNVHTFPGARYELFSFSRGGDGSWQAFVHPEYYGMLMFAEAYPPGAQQLPVSVAPGPVKVWATRTVSGAEHIVLINKDTTTQTTVQLSLPNPGAPASLERLIAPSAAATIGVSLGGRTFGAQTTTGTLPGPEQTETVYPVLGTYSVTLPPSSAAMLTR